MVAGMAMPVSLTGVKARPHEAWHDQAPAEPSTKTDHLDLPALPARPHASHAAAPRFQYRSMPSVQTAVPLGSEHDEDCGTVTRITDCILFYH